MYQVVGDNGECRVGGIVDDARRGVVFYGFVGELPACLSQSRDKPSKPKKANHFARVGK